MVDVIVYLLEVAPLVVPISVVIGLEHRLNLL